MNDLVFRDLDVLLQGSHSYIDRYKQELGNIHKGLWKHLDLVPQLSPQAQQLVLAYFLELGCQAQNTLNIELGRASLLALPKEWLLENIEEASDPLLQTNEAWEYRRLLEIYCKLDKNLVHKLASWGLKSTNPEIEETAKEYLSEEISE